MPDPIYTSHALQIASDPNFSALGDPYDGTVTKLVPADAVITQGLARPKRQLGSQWRNWLDQQFAAILTAIIVNLAAIEATDSADELTLASFRQRMRVNFPYASLPGVGNFMRAACWNAFTGRWLTLNVDGGTSINLYANGDGRGNGQAGSWATAAGLSGLAFAQAYAAACIAVNPSTGLISWITGTKYYVGNGVTNANLPAAVIASGTPTFGNGGMLFFAGLFVAIGSQVTGIAPFHKAALITSPDATTWTDRSATLSTTTLQVSITFAVAASPTVMVAWSADTGSAVGGLYSADGITWSAMALPVFVGARTVGGVAWSSTASLFMVAVNIDSSANTEFYTSPDGITWTLRGTFVAPQVADNVIGLAACADVWLALIDNAASDVDAGQTYFSVDNGVTWTKGPATLDPQAMPNAVVSNGKQFLLVSKKGVRGSIVDV